MSTFNRKRQINKAIAKLESQEPVEWNEHFLKSLSAWSGLTVEKVQEILNDPRYIHPPQRTEQEPVKLPCCGYTDASAVKWNPFNRVVQCHNCGQTYTHPPQRTWVELTDEERSQLVTLRHG